jgi:nitrate reductase gamma subunit
MQDLYTVLTPMNLTAILTLAFPLFLIGTAIRIIRIAAMPVHVRWELYPMPEGMLNKTRAMMSEILLLRGVYDHHRALWLWSWLFHASLYLLIALTLLSLIAPLIPSARNGITLLIAILSIPTFAGGMAGTAALIMMRLVHPRLRSYTSFAALFNLTLLFAIFLSGLAHVLIQPAAAGVMVEQSGSLLRVNPAPLLHPITTAHLCLIALFAVYFPFTQMAHAVLKYFTYHSVRWDDRTADQMPQHADRLRRYLAFPVKWSAPHIQGGKTETSWADVVAGKGTDTKLPD